MNTQNTTTCMTEKHPRWHEFLGRLEGPEGCNFREHEDGYTHDCRADHSKSRARAILQMMGFPPEAIEASCKYFDEHDGGCECEILMNMVHLREVNLVLSGKRDPKKCRRMFKHLSDDALCNILARLAEIDPEAKGYSGALFSVAFMQRDMWEGDFPE